MAKNVYETAFKAAASAAVLLLIATAYLYGKSSRQSPLSAASEKTSSSRMLVGRLVRTEPLHVYIESAGFGTKQTFDVLISPQTEVLQLVDWSPGEREKAVEERDAYLMQLNPEVGQPVPPPIPQMKPVPLELSSLAPGADIGILALDPIDPAKPIIALFIRPLSPLETRTGQVSSDFPL